MICWIIGILFGKWAMPILENARCPSLFDAHLYRSCFPTPVAGGTNISTSQPPELLLVAYKQQIHCPQIFCLRRTVIFFFLRLATLIDVNDVILPTSTRKQKDQYFNLEITINMDTDSVRGSPTSGSGQNKWKIP